MRKMMTFYVFATVLMACGSSPAHTARVHAYETCGAALAASAAAEAATGKSDLQIAADTLPSFLACMFNARNAQPPAAGSGS